MLTFRIDYIQFKVKMSGDEPFNCPICTHFFGDSIVPTTFSCGHSCCLADAEKLTKCPLCCAAISKPFSPSFSLRDGSKMFQELKSQLEDVKTALESDRSSTLLRKGSFKPKQHPARPVPSTVSTSTMSLTSESTMSDEEYAQMVQMLQEMGVDDIERYKAEERMRLSGVAMLDEDEALARTLQGEDLLALASVPASPASPVKPPQPPPSPAARAPSAPLAAVPVPEATLPQRRPPVPAPRRPTASGSSPRLAGVPRRECEHFCAAPPLTGPMCCFCRVQRPPVAGQRVENACQPCMRSSEPLTSAPECVLM